MSGAAARTGILKKNRSKSIYKKRKVHIMKKYDAHKRKSLIRVYRKPP